MQLRERWVWITGASSGLGRELARQLAAEGANLLVTARRADRLESLKAELAPSGVQVRPLVGDMGNGDDVVRLLHEVRAVENLAAAVFNAGVTHFGHHGELSWEDFDAMLRVNLISTARLTSELAKHLHGVGQPARIMLVTSMAGLAPVPYQSAYSGTKAFLTAFGMALAHELEASPVSVTVFAPGGVQTEMTAGEKFGPLRGWLAPVDEVAREAVQALRDGKPLHVPGFTNRMGLFLFRFLPRNLVMGQVARQYRKALEVVGQR